MYYHLTGLRAFLYICIFHKIFCPLCSLFIKKAIQHSKCAHTFCISFPVPSQLTWSGKGMNKLYIYRQVQKRWYQMECACSNQEAPTTKDLSLFIIHNTEERIIQSWYEIIKGVVSGCSNSERTRNNCQFLHILVNDFLNYHTCTQCQKMHLYQRKYLPSSES